MIRSATPADKAAIIQILSSSFTGNQSVKFITGTGTGANRKIAALMDYAFEVCSLFGEVLITVDQQACALLLYPNQKKTNLKSVLLDLKLVLNCIGLNRVFKVIRREAALKAQQPKGPKAYLWFIGVSPENQHNGIGSALLSEVIAYCEKQGRFMVLETSTLKNIPWYKNFLLSYTPAS